MYCTIATKDFKDGLNFINKLIVESCKPILEMVRIDIGPNIMLTSTDCETFLSWNIPGIESNLTEIETVLIPAQKLLKLVSKIKSDSVRLTIAKENSLVIEYGNTIHKIRSDFLVEDYPVFPEKKGDKVISISSEVLCEKLNCTSSCIEKTLKDSPFNFLLIEDIGNELNFVVTDGTRLAYHGDEKIEVKEKLVIPYKAVLILKSIYKKIKSKEYIYMDFTKDAVNFRSSFFCLSTQRLAHNNFPAWRQVIPKDQESIFEIDANQLIEALEISKLTGIAVDFYFHGKKLCLKSELDGELTETNVVYKRSLLGSDVKIMLNPDFVLDFLKLYKEKTLRFKVKSADMPLLIEPLEGKNKYILMPIIT